jgi:hypothetical protein
MGDTWKHIIQAFLDLIHFLCAWYNDKQIKGCLLWDPSAHPHLLEAKAKGTKTTW